MSVQVVDRLESVQVQVCDREWTIIRERIDGLAEHGLDAAAVQYAGQRIVLRQEAEPFCRFVSIRDVLQRSFYPIFRYSGLYQKPLGIMAAPAGASNFNFLTGPSRCQILQSGPAPRVATIAPAILSDAVYHIATLERVTSRILAKKNARTNVPKAAVAHMKGRYLE